jgi:hypothetical protein
MKRRRTVKQPRRSATTATPRTSDKKKITLLARQLNEALKHQAATSRELSESLERETATSQVLGIISSSPSGSRPPTGGAVMKNPLKQPGVKEKLVAAIEEAIQPYTGRGAAGFEEYCYWQTDQDGYMDVIESLGVKLSKQFDDWFESQGEYPTEDVRQLFAKAEKKAFGTAVDARM